VTYFQAHRRGNRSVRVLLVAAVDGAVFLLFLATLATLAWLVTPS